MGRRSSVRWPPPRLPTAAQRRSRRGLVHVRGRVAGLTEQKRATLLQQVVTRVTVTGDAVEIDLVPADARKWGRPGCPV